MRIDENSTPEGETAPAPPLTDTPVDLTKEIEAVRSYIAKSALYYLEDGKKNRQEAHEMAEWGLSRIRHYTRAPAPLPDAAPTPDPKGRDEALEAATYSVSLIAEYLRQVSRFDGDLLEKNWNSMASYIKSIQAPTNPPGTAKGEDKAMHLIQDKKAEQDAEALATILCFNGGPHGEPNLMGKCMRCGTDIV